MTREIKFRAWDEEKKEMFGWDSQNSFVLDSHSGKVQKRLENGNTQDIDFPVMQFTGLLDKNGKEIYEGDIVKFRQTGNLYPVVFENGSFRISGARTYGFKNLEIIGNIYENPELIK